jgi:hypothetical protein
MIAESAALRDCNLAHVGWGQIRLYWSFGSMSALDPHSGPLSSGVRAAVTFPEPGRRRESCMGSCLAFHRRTGPRSQRSPVCFQSITAERLRGELRGMCSHRQRKISHTQAPMEIPATPITV